MKVVGISAGRNMGNSEILLRSALKAVEEEGHEVVLIRLHDYNIKPCVGCELCTKLGRAGEQVHCMYKWEDDDFYALMSQINDAQGIILAAPAYHLMPPGIVTVLVNRLHSFGYSSMFANLHDGDPAWRKVCATIAVGGSNWQSLQLPIMNFQATELICSQMNLVDQMSANSVPAVSMVVTRPDYMERARQLGKNVAKEIVTEGKPTYHGDRPEACPLCHNSLLVLRNGRVACAICDVEGDPVIGTDGKIAHIHWDGGAEKSRFSHKGGKEHDEVMLKTVKLEGKKGYIFTDEQKEMIKEEKAKWQSYFTPLKPAKKEQ